MIFLRFDIDSALGDFYNSTALEQIKKARTF